MIKNIQYKNTTVSRNQVVEFINQKINEERKKEENRKNLMKKQLSEVTGDKNIIVSNYHK
jgi:hypothetical protein